MRAMLWIVMAAMTFTTSLAHAQSLWIPRDVSGSVTLEVLKPRIWFFDDKFFTAAFFVDVRAPLGEQASWVAELPFATYQDGDTNAAVGNIYLGIEARAAHAPIFGEFGVRFPTAREDGYPATLVGSVADRGRYGAFFARTVSAQGAFNLRTVTSGFAHRVRLGAGIAVSTEGEGATAFGLFAWQAAYEGRAVRAGAAISGQLDLSSNGGGLGSSALTQVELHADAGTGRVRPGLELKLPLGDSSILTSVVLGVSVSVPLGSLTTSE